MNLPWIVRWALRQGLGKARGEVVIGLLSGPLGLLIDYATGGKIAHALGQVDKAAADVAKVASGASQ